MAQPGHIVGKFKDPDLTINSVDLSAFVRSVTLRSSRPSEEVNASQSGGWVGTTVGRASWTMEVEFYQSFYTSELDATLEPLSRSTTSTPIVLVATDDAVGATNPSYSGDAWITEYSPIAGTVDENLMAPITLVGDGELTRAES